jgi:hypothetical protein
MEGRLMIKIKKTSQPFRIEIDERYAGTITESGESVVFPGGMMNRPFTASQLRYIANKMDDIKDGKYD